VRTLLWYRNDLRIHDHEALAQACRTSDEGVIAVFAICPKQWAAHDWGIVKVDFVLRNVRELSERLTRIGIPLKLIRADDFQAVPQKLMLLAKRHRCETLAFHREHEVNERRRDEEVVRLFEQRGLTVKQYRDQTILEVEEIRTGAGGWYTKFTPFKRKWLALLEEQDASTASDAPRPRCRIDDIAGDEVPETVKGFAGAGTSALWPAGETAARRRLTRFVKERVEDYAIARDIPAEDGTSALSPYLAVGARSPRTCVEAALAANSGRASGGREGVDTWITELIWREFYRHVLVGFPRVSMHRPFDESTARVPWRQDEKQFRAWTEGRTGFPIVDAGMRQLAETGWMHNRLRMITAMFLTKDLFIDWRWGEAHFMRSLVDGDLASNNGGWQWSASTGTDAVPYFRVFNPYRQSRRIDPGGDFIRRYVPELANLDDRAIHEPSAEQARASGYPTPVVDHPSSVKRVREAFKAHRTSARRDPG